MVVLVLPSYWPEDSSCTDPRPNAALLPEGKRESNTSTTNFNLNNCLCEINESENGNCTVIRHV